MTHPGHNPAIPMVKVGTQSQIMLQVKANILYYIITPLNDTPYFFKGTPVIPAFIIANEDILADIEKMLSIPFLPLEEWRGDKV